MNKILSAARLLAVVAFSAVSINSQAAAISGLGQWETSLLARDWAGNGPGVDAYYDPLLNITWLADARYPLTSGFDADGLMTFDEANAWAAGLTLFGGEDWRLPTMTPLVGLLLPGNLPFNTALSFDGTTDFGYARNGIGWGVKSEMGFMHYVHLARGRRSSNTGPILNLVPIAFWTNVEDRANPNFVEAWAFDFFDGYQFLPDRQTLAGAWAVHPGDLIGPNVPSPEPVPLPGAIWLLATALAGMGFSVRRR